MQVEPLSGSWTQAWKGHFGCRRPKKIHRWEVFCSWMVSLLIFLHFNFFRFEEKRRRRRRRRRRSWSPKQFKNWEQEQQQFPWFQRSHVSTTTFGGDSSYHPNKQFLRHVDPPSVGNRTSKVSSFSNQKAWRWWNGEVQNIWIVWVHDDEFHWDGGWNWYSNALESSFAGIMYIHVCCLVCIVHQ